MLLNLDDCVKIIRERMSSSVELSGSTSATATPTADIQTVVSNDYVPECDADKTPKLEQRFSTLSEAETFYRNYASVCGFSVRLGTTKRGRNTDVFQMRRMLCTKEGKRRDKEKKTERVRLVTRVGCNAMIIFQRQKDGAYKVTKFQAAHNHILASPNSMLFMKENRTMTSIQKTFVVKAARLKLGPVRAFRGWKELCGGYGNVGATENDFKNFVRDVKNYIGDFDGQMFIENFIRKKEMCNGFSFDFDIDEAKRLCKVFWADPICRKNNAFFGDMISIDSTFKMNKYDMVFVPFTGVDQHKRCVILGAGLLAHEDVESYVWLFNAFLEAMDGSHPKVIISDQCPAMKIAIEKVFPGTPHRLCTWHIMKKLREKISAGMWQDKEFKKRFNNCVWNNLLDREEFEAEWESVMTQYNLHDHVWFAELKRIKEQWIPAYFRDIFMGGLMRVTSRSESENSFFDRFVTSSVTLVEFWMCFESAMDAQRYKQSKLNSDNKHSSVPLKTPLDLEKDASKIYTHAIFKDFQEELYAALFFCGMIDMTKVEEAEVYSINDTEQDMKKWDVTYTESSGEVSCTCCLFQRMGLLCRHIIWVLNSKNKKTIPEKYIVDRWTKNALNRPMFDKSGNIIGDDAVRWMDKKRKSTELWEVVYSCVSLAEESEDAIQLLTEKLRDIKLELQQCRTNERTTSSKDYEMERYVGCSMPKEINIKVPKQSKNKGSGKRIESSVLKALAKRNSKQRICSRCGVKGHNSRSCAQIVEEDEEKQEETTAESRKQRTCSKCGEKGHNTRTCSHDGEEETEEDGDEGDTTEESEEEDNTE